MKYILMHNRFPVAEIGINNQTGEIKGIGEIYAPDRMPLGTLSNGYPDECCLFQWWCDRCIPYKRPQIEEALKVMQLGSPQTLAVRSCGLSLTDHYWIKPADSSIDWHDVNFFANDFSQDVGDILIGKTYKRSGIDLCSPDCTTNGNLPKRWKLSDNKRYLIKAGTNVFFQQPINEVIASMIMDRINIKHVPYSLLWNGVYPYSACECFTTANAEFISAHDIKRIREPIYNESSFEHYLNCCRELGVNDIVRSLDEMIVIDYIIANEDRHFGNFGLLRNSETLEWRGAAPIFDCGNSLGYNSATHRFSEKISCKPFRNTHEEQLELVASFDWIDFDKLESINMKICDFMSDQKMENFIDETRRNLIVSFIEDRIENLKNRID